MTSTNHPFPSRWLEELTGDLTMRMKATAVLRNTYDGTDYQVPDIDDVIHDALTLIAGDIRESAGDLHTCDHVDDCTAKAIVLRHLANMLNPTNDEEQR